MLQCLEFLELVAPRAGYSQSALHASGIAGLSRIRPLLAVFSTNTLPSLSGHIRHVKSMRDRAPCHILT